MCKGMHKMMFGYKIKGMCKIVQPQVCYHNPKQDMLNLKSIICRKVSNVAKTILGVNITGKELFESVGSLSAPAP